METDGGRAESGARRTARRATATAIFLAPVPVFGVVASGELGAFLAGVCFFPPIWLCWILLAIGLRKRGGFASRAPDSLFWAVIGMLWGQLIVFLTFCLFMPGDQNCFQDCEGVPVGPSVVEYLLGIRTGSPRVGVLTLPDAVLGALFEGASVLFVAAPAVWVGWLLWDYARRRRSRPSA